MAKLPKIKIIALAVSTMGIALAAGHFMTMNKGKRVVVVTPTIQQAPTIKETLASVTSEPTEELQVTDITMTSALPVAPATAFEAAVLPQAPVEQVALQDAPVVTMPTEEPTPAFSCEYALTATPSAAAMVSLKLDAPCMPNERFTIHHNGMMFTDATNDEGSREIMVPALSQSPIFIVAFANGEGAVAGTELSSFEYYDRVVVQWKGESGLRIHALEYESDYGDAGHVWAESTHDVSDAATGEGGFMTRLGAPDMGEGLTAEVYTFPSGLAPRAGEILLQVEAEVNTGNCGRDIEAQSIQLSEDGTLKVQDLTLSIPECTAVGDFLVLKNLLNDLKIAQN